jgi:hypothetical protein
MDFEEILRQIQGNTTWNISFASRPLNQVIFDGLKIGQAESSTVEARWVRGAECCSSPLES